MGRICRLEGGRFRPALIAILKGSRDIGRNRSRTHDGCAFQEIAS
jgi:hypothetical protein